MLLDRFLPEYDFSERHETTVAAPKEAVRRAFDTWRPPRGPTRLLFALRRVPAPSGTLREWALSLGFVVLAESDDELVLGQIGQFWAFNEREALVSPKTVEEFLAFDDPAYAVTAMTLFVEALSADRTKLYTETRVRALGPGARRRFRLYWLLIRPFSGMLRRIMLRGMRKAAERSKAGKGSPLS